MANLWIIDDAGITIPTSQQVKQRLRESAVAEGLGADYLFHPEDPITVLFDVFGAEIASIYQLGEVAVNSRDPEQAQGSLLRELASLVGAAVPTRSRSTIPGRLVGSPNTLVPRFSILRYAPSGDLWRTVESRTIEPSGLADIELEAVEFGAAEAAAAGMENWQIQTPVAGWTGFLSIDEAAVGRSAPSNPEIREAILRSARSESKATQDADIANVSLVENVSLVRLIVNRRLTTEGDLDGKEGLFVVGGGKKQDIFDAIAASISTSLNVEETGKVKGVSVRPSGDSIKVSYTRPVDVPILVRATIGGDLDAFTNDQKVALVEEAILARAALQGFGESFVPKQYEAVITNSFPLGTIKDCLVEVRLTTGDAWQTTPLVLGNIERAVVSASPRPASATSTPEDPINLNAGLYLELEVDGGAPQDFTTTEAHDTVASLVLELVPEFSGVSFIDLDGRFVVATQSTGPGSSLVISGPLATILVIEGTFNGSLSDITTVIL